LEAPGYIATQFDPKLPLGSIHPVHGYRCEDLSSQTFADGSFDIVVTQDVFEHLPDPKGAIRDIARTLRPNGAHICSVPIVRKWAPSGPRVMWDASGNVEYLFAPEYHGNPIDDSGSLVVWDWGYDIASIFTEHSGMRTIIMQIDNIELGIRAEFIEVVVSVKPG
jgi:SAM-dependent methyltransferase